ncbi:hypothetical protein TWF730_008100 [Orbilia blumenaviensis]|uniref:Uncharacterized protein n=1 Tax=Orbilia blumenaviensis TaxID=1796055 RepID=A0AAV9VCD5_9PEZI
MDPSKERFKQASSPFYSQANKSSQWLHSAPKEEVAFPTTASYNLTRWASYPRSSVPSGRILTLLQQIAKSRNTVFSGPEMRNILAEPSTASSSTSLICQKLESMRFDLSTGLGITPEREEEGQSPSSAPSFPPQASREIETFPHEMSTCKPSTVPETSSPFPYPASESSGGTFRTAESRSNDERPASSVSLGARGHHEAQPAAPITIQTTTSVASLHDTTLKSLEPVPVPFVLGSKPSTSHHNLERFFHDGKTQQSGPLVPPKPSEYRPTPNRGLEENKKPEPTVTPSPKPPKTDKSTPPSMLIFKVLRTTTNQKTQECEYTIQYKWSGKNPYFPAGRVFEEVFTFDELCEHRAVIARIRGWHSTHIGVSKDPRVEDTKYRLSADEYKEIDRYPWPPFDPRGWYRCLVWGNFGSAWDSF